MARYHNGVPGGVGHSHVAPSMDGARLVPTARGLFTRVGAAYGILRISVAERILRSNATWQALYCVAAGFNHIGLRDRAARLFAAGQRSAPQRMRGKFGAVAARIIDRLGVSGVLRGNEGIPANRIRVIKPYLGPREKGVMHVMFSDAISVLPKLRDLCILNSYYRLVLEPSWAGACDPGLLQYAHASCKNIIMMPDAADFAFVESLESQLVPIRLGSADWVDPRVAEPFLGRGKEFDVVMNASWAPWKRHHVLFAAMRRMRTKPKVALIGVPWDGGDLDRIARLAAYYGVEEHITVYERIPFAKVMEVVSRARCCVLLSLKEGANRALPESMFCDVPVVLLAEYVGGAEKNIVPQTGLVVPQRRLGLELDRIIRGEVGFEPRKWAVANISCLVSTDTLNSRLRQVAEAEGESWTQDVVVRSNSPESCYFDPKDDARLAAANAALLAFVRGDKDAPADWSE